MLNRTFGSRLDKARSVFHRLSKVWRTGEFRRETKLRIFKSNIIAVLLYGCETWRMTKADEKRLDTFLHKCLRRILKVHWPMRVSNYEIRKRAGIKKISSQVWRRRWKWIGHVLRMAPNRNPYVALSWAPSGKRSRGWPRETWWRTVEKEHTELGLKSWAAVRPSLTSCFCRAELNSGIKFGMAEVLRINQTKN